MRRPQENKQGCIENSSGIGEAHPIYTRLGRTAIASRNPSAVRLYKELATLLIVVQRPFSCTSDNYIAGTQYFPGYAVPNYMDPQFQAGRGQLNSIIQLLESYLDGH